MISDYINNRPSEKISSPQSSERDLNSRVYFITIISKQNLATNPEKVLLRALQQYIITTSWKTGLTGDIALYNTNPPKKIKVPHEITRQLQAIENYAKNPCRETAEEAITCAFKKIPERFLRKKQSTLSHLQNFFRPGLIKKFYSRFRPDIKNRQQLIKMLDLNNHLAATKLLNSLLPTQ